MALHSTGGKSCQDPPSPRHWSSGVAGIMPLVGPLCPDQWHRTLHPPSLRTSHVQPWTLLWNRSETLCTHLTNEVVTGDPRQDVEQVCRVSLVGEGCVLVIEPLWWGLPGISGGGLEVWRRPPDMPRCGCRPGRYKRYSAHGEERGTKVRKCNGHACHFH